MGDCEQGGDPKARVEEQDAVWLSAAWELKAHLQRGGWGYPFREEQTLILRLLSATSAAQEERAG